MRSCLFNLALRLHYVAWFGSGWYHEIDGTKQVTRGRRRQRALNLIELKKEWITSCKRKQNKHESW